MNWRTAAGEIVLIVIGVTIALAGGAWYEGRMERRDERFVLQQLQDALRLDQQALNRTRDMRAGQLADVRGLAAAYEAGGESPPELNYGAVLQFVTVNTNSAPYEALKSRGFELISNAELRLNLIRYYEDVFTSVSGSTENDREFYSRSAHPYFLEYLRATLDGSLTARWVPLNSGELYADTYYWNLLGAKMQRLEVRLLPYLDDAIDLVEDLQVQIEEELGFR